MFLPHQFHGIVGQPRAISSAACNAVMSSEVMTGCQICHSNISRACLASLSSDPEATSDFADQSGGVLSGHGFQQHVSSAANGEVGLVDHKKPFRRPFCKKCCKAASMCICHHIKIVVKNRTLITILQHPQEKNHHLGSARIALLGLQNVELVSVPEVDEQVSYRMRMKVPGSKRFIAGRGGKQQESGENSLKKTNTPQKRPSEPTIQPPQCTISGNLPISGSGVHDPVEFDTTALGGLEDTARDCKDEVELWSRVPPWINLRPDAGVLFPSEQALDLWPDGLKLISISESDSVLTFQSKKENGVHRNSPSQLLVLDGTWSKAKRIFFENPWLRHLPHYRLPTLQDSRYGWLRREPKPGCLSTVESIVFALQLLEPSTQNLGSLLDVFDKMIEDQKKCMRDKSKFLKR